MKLKGKLRVCAKCEYIYKFNDRDCPKCGFGHYSAHFVYGQECYKLFKTQEKWIKKKLDSYQNKLEQEVSSDHLINKTLDKMNHVIQSKDLFKTIFKKDK